MIRCDRRLGEAASACFREGTEQWSLGDPVTSCGQANTTRGTTHRDEDSMNEQAAKRGREDQGVLEAPQEKRPWRPTMSRACEDILR